MDKYPPLHFGMLRGKCIGIAVKLNKEGLEKEKQLESDIKRLGHEHKTTGAAHTLRQLQCCREALDDLLTREAEGALRYTSEKHYEMGNRAACLSFR